MSKKHFRLSGIWFISLFWIISTQLLRADDKAANKAFQEGLELFNNKEYLSAAKSFVAAELYADDTVIKANAVQAAANAYRNGKLLYKEFECLEKLLKSYPNFIISLMNLLLYWQE